MRTLSINAAVSLFSAFLGVFIYTLFFQPNPETIIYRVEAEKAPVSSVAHVAFNNNKTEENKPPLSNFTYAANRSRPAVVHIKSIQKANPYSPISRRWNSGTNIEDEVESRSGSGVIISEDGYIVTNKHVIEDSDLIEVTLHSKKTHLAKLIGIDDLTDLALLKIREDQLSFITMANSDEVKVGEWVMAVGNPFNLASTVTAGIVSAKGRDPNISTYDSAIESYIQSDAAVNKGSSGGALVNISGELIGINTAIASATGNFEGYSFAIPVNITRKVIFDLKEFGFVRRAYLGIDMRNLNPNEDDVLNLDDFNGIYIVGINENSAAADSHLKAGDIIKKIDGYAVNSVAELKEQINQFQPDDVISVAYLRAGKPFYTRIQLKLIKDTEVSNEMEALLGVKFQELPSSELKKSYLQHGIQIIQINRGLIGSNTSIKTGFIISEINNKHVFNTEQFYEIIRQIKDGNDKAITLTGRYPNEKTDRFFAFGLKK